LTLAHDDPRPERANAHLSLDPPDLCPCSSAANRQGTYHELATAKRVLASVGQQGRQHEHRGQNRLSFIRQAMPPVCGWLEMCHRIICILPSNQVCRFDDRLSNNKPKGASRSRWSSRHRNSLFGTSARRRLILTLTFLAKTKRASFPWSTEPDADCQTARLPDGAENELFTASRKRTSA
jgi:hypothetical protein